MDLVLWRHAEAEERPEGDLPEGRDLDRPLTARGDKQAARMAVWLDRQLPEGARILVSPARRCEQTALSLGRKYKVCAQLGPDGTLEQLLALAQWPSSKLPILVVGHQPSLVDLACALLHQTSLPFTLAPATAVVLHGDGPSAPWSVGLVLPPP